jgi:hypothetical protein
LALRQHPGDGESTGVRLRRPRALLCDPVGVETGPEPSLRRRRFTSEPGVAGGAPRWK